MEFTDWLGFSGVFILLIAFFLNLINVLQQNSRIYMLLNILGAGIACAASVLIHFMPFIVLEGTWTLVSLVVFVKSFIKNGA